MVVSNGSMSCNQPKLPCVVADSSAFLRNVDLQNLGDHIFTIKEVVGEIRDASTKQRLAVLPYDLDFRTPSAESLQFVTEFSKKTGDYRALSAVDLRVLALTYQLEKEFCSVEHINLEPSKKAVVVHKAKVISDKEIAGFYYEPKGEKKLQPAGDKIVEEGIPMQVNDAEMAEVVPDISEQFRGEETCSNDDAQNRDGDVGDGAGGNDDGNGGAVDNDKKNGDDDNDDYDDDHDDDDDDQEEEEEEEAESGWITPGNIQKVKQTFGTVEDTKIEDGNVKCACLTTDFAMQNVLIQMGLHVLSVRGMLIRQARSYIQKCFGCYKETHDMTRIFCPSCGNKTLQKVAVSIGEDGVMQYHYPKRLKNPNIRGTKFSIPAPKGGRIVDTVLLAEDQPTGRNHMPRTRDKADPLDPDYAARTNPFSVKDVNSRAFNLGLHVKQKQARNPNENRKNKSGRKK